MRNCGPFLALILVGCQPAPPADTVESLVADPERLQEVQRQCRQDYAKAGEVLCNAASEAYRRRFMGGGADEKPE
ncbi:EexN family lipoprotein [Luteimonas sp. BDR2-5]|nr:EexN family lipoprotein [Luteimonas sp. BDR2-5]MCD9026630.1 EexN family lipoprotein [Luteimonas sp. BDR2-5]